MPFVGRTQPRAQSVEAIRLEVGLAHCPRECIVVFEPVKEFLIVVGHAGLDRTAVQLAEYAGPEPARQLVVNARLKPTVTQTSQHGCQRHELRAIG